MKRFFRLFKKRKKKSRKDKLNIYVKVTKNGYELPMAG